MTPFSYFAWTVLSQVTAMELIVGARDKRDLVRLTNSFQCTRPYLSARASEREPTSF